MEPPPTPPPSTGNARVVLAIVGGVLLLCCALTGGMMLLVRSKLRDAGFPHASQAEAEAALREVGPEVVLAEARALAQAHPSGTELVKHMGDPLPAGIARLPLIYVRVEPSLVSIKISGMGDWSGFLIPLDGTTPEGAELVEPGIYWIDIH